MGAGVIMRVWCLYIYKTQAAIKTCCNLINIHEHCSHYSIWVINHWCHCPFRTMGLKELQLTTKCMHLFVHDYNSCCPQSSLCLNKSIKVHQYIFTNTTSREKQISNTFAIRTDLQVIATKLYLLGISGVDEPPGITAKRLSQPPAEWTHKIS